MKSPIDPNLLGHPSIPGCTSIYLMNQIQCPFGTVVPSCCNNSHISTFYTIPGTQMTSIFEGQPPKTRPFSIKTRVMWVPGMYIYISLEVLQFCFCVWIFPVETSRFIVFAVSKSPPSPPPEKSRAAPASPHLRSIPHRSTTKLEIGEKPYFFEVQDTGCNCVTNVG